MDDQTQIRVAQVIGKMLAGGVETFVFNYYREIDKSKIQFDFYYDEDSSVEPPKDLLAMGARFIKLPPYQKLWKYIITLKKHIKENQYIIIHSHLNTLSVFPLFSAWLSGVPIRIAHNHSVTGGNEKFRNGLKCFLRLFSKLLATDYCACSEKAGRWLFGNRSYDDGLVKIIRNAIDYNTFFSNEKNKKKILSYYKLEGKFVVGHVGRFTFAKNYPFLFDVFIEIKRERSNAVLLLVGDGELHNLIVDNINKYGLSDSVIMVGKTLHPEIYYNAMNVMVLPSIFEGLSIATVEAQASSVPVVISTAIPEEALISDGYRYLNINEKPNIWAEQAIALSSKKPKFLNSYKDYDIKVAAPQLTDWYLEKYRSIKK